MQDLRENIRKDKDCSYTYSDKYLSLSIDPYTIEEVKKSEKESEKRVILIDYCNSSETRKQAIL